jgi:hypothetical protein
VNGLNIPFNLGSVSARPRPRPRDPTLTREEQEEQDEQASSVSNLNQGCKHKRIEWARIESNLPTINLDVGLAKSIKIGKCSEKLEGASWAKLVTNAGERLLNVNNDYYISFNFLPCGFGLDLDVRGLSIFSTENPTCFAEKQAKQEKVTCKLKEIKWARIESNLLPIGLNIDRKHVIGGCSKEFPRMEWARLVTDAGSAELDLNFTNEIELNAFSCRNRQVGAKVTKHKDCLSPQQQMKMTDIIITRRY